jgi:hypothetical protein
LKLGQLRLPKFFRRSPSPQAAQSAPSAQPGTISHLPQSTQISAQASAPQLTSRSPNNAPFKTTPFPISQAKTTTPSIQAPRVIETTAESVRSEDPLSQDNPYTAIGGLPTVVAVPGTRAHRAKEAGSVAYEGVKLTLQALSDTAGMCPPLKTAVAGLLTIIKLVDVCGLMYDLCSWIFHLSFCLLN